VDAAAVVAPRSPDAEKSADGMSLSACLSRSPVGSVPDIAITNVVASILVCERTATNVREGLSVARWLAGGYRAYASLAVVRPHLVAGRDDEGGRSDRYACRPYVRHGYRSRSRSDVTRIGKNALLLYARARARVFLRVVVVASE